MRVSRSRTCMCIFLDSVGILRSISQYVPALRGMAIALRSPLLLLPEKSLRLLISMLDNSSSEWVFVKVHDNSHIFTTLCIPRIRRSQLLLFLSKRLIMPCRWSGKSVMSLVEWLRWKLNYSMISDFLLLATLDSLGYYSRHIFWFLLRQVLRM